MSIVRLNDKGFKKAAELIEAGDIITDPSKVCAAVIGEGFDPGEVCVGIVTGEDRAKASAWEYPIITQDGKVSRPAVILARARAVSRGHTPIAEAAGQLLALIDGDEGSRGLDNIGAVGFAAGASMIEAVEWDDMAEGVIQLFPYGPSDLVDGRHYVINEISMGMVPRLFAQRSNPMVIDYEHRTYSSEPFASLAAGWMWAVLAAWPATDEGDITTSEVSAESLDEITAEMGAEAADRIAKSGPGVYALVKWTAKAAELIRNREYQFISPVFSHTNEGVVLELFSAALTNDPAFEGMMAAAAKRLKSKEPDKSGNLDISASGDTVGRTKADRQRAGEPAKTTGGQDMDWKTLAAQMGIQADSEEDFVAKAAALRQQAEQGATATTRVAELEAEKVKAKAEADVDTLIAEGKLHKDQREAFIDLATNDRERFDVIAGTLKPIETEPGGPDKPPQGRQTSQAAADQNGDAILKFNISSAEGHRIDPERLAKANAVIAKASASQGGNTAKAIRILGRSTITQ